MNTIPWLPLKWLAFFGMVVQHGFLLQETPNPLGILIGFWSFPLFVWILAHHLASTDDPATRALRYLLWMIPSAVIAQIPFSLLTERWLLLNTMGSLAIGVACTMLVIDNRWFSDAAPSRRILTLYLILLCISASPWEPDYGIPGILAIVFGTLLMKNRRPWLALCAILFFTLIFYDPRGEEGVLFLLFLLMTGLVLFFFVQFSKKRHTQNTNSRSSWKERLFFYGLYPGHLLVLGIMAAVSRLTESA